MAIYPPPMLCNTHSLCWDWGRNKCLDPASSLCICFCMNVHVCECVFHRSPLGLWFPQKFCSSSNTIQHTHIFVADPSLSACHDFGSIQLVVKHYCAVLDRRTCNQHLMNTECHLINDGFMTLKEVDLLLLTCAIMLFFSVSLSEHHFISINQKFTLYCMYWCQSKFHYNAFLSPICPFFFFLGFCPPPPSPLTLM